MILIISLTILNSINSGTFSLSTKIVMGVPFSPLKSFIACSNVKPSVSKSSIRLILSFALTPILSAGVPSIGEIIVSFSSLIPITIPKPPKLPLLSIRKSSNKSG